MSQLHSIMPLLLIPYMLGAGQISNDLGLGLDSNQDPRDSFGGRSGHNAQGYIKERTGYKKINNIGRNDPCECGSGIKYKKCCGG